MKYLKTFEIQSNREMREQLPIIRKELDQVFDDCQPFVKDLKNCKRLDFLVRGVDDTKIIMKKFNHDMENRKPVDMPIKIHDILNKHFDEKFGWKVRNALFCFGRNEKVFVGYGDASYFVFPIGEYKIAWSKTYKDLFLSLYDLRSDVKVSGFVDEELEKRLKFVVDQYQIGDLPEAIRHKKEICINTDQYYLLNVERYRSELIRKLWDM